MRAAEVAERDVQAHGCQVAIENNLVFDRIASGLLKELQSKTPKNDRGYWPHRMHQWLTEDVGDPMLAQHLHFHHHDAEAGYRERIWMDALHSHDRSGDAASR
jgi:hypothetical protein